MQRRAKIGYQCSYVDAELARTHIATLRKAGMGLRHIAQVAGINRKSIQILLYGRVDRGTPPSKRIARSTSVAILSVAIPGRDRDAVAAGGLVDAVGTVRRLQALIAWGYPRSHLGALMGWTGGQTSCSGNIGALLIARQVRASTAAKVDEIFRSLQNTVGPSERARAEGAKKGWALPIQWDEAALDDPRTGVGDVAARRAAVSARGHSQAATERRREAQHRRWRAELNESLLAKAQRAQTDAMVTALSVALFGDDEQDWRERAVCAQVDADLWFPEKGGSTREAKKVCLSCPVRAQCLAFALENEERFGIWGGKSERERRRMMNNEQEAS
jgi:hypothetical protein